MFTILSQLGVLVCPMGKQVTRAWQPGNHWCMCSHHRGNNFPLTVHAHTPYCSYGSTVSPVLSTRVYWHASSHRNTWHHATLQVVVGRNFPSVDQHHTMGWIGCIRCLQYKRGFLRCSMWNNTSL